MSTKKNYPTGEGIGPASVRGDSIIAYYQQQVPGATAADLVADILASVAVDQQVSHGEARAEGTCSTAPSPECVIDDAEEALRDMIRSAERETQQADL